MQPENAETDDVATLPDIVLTEKALSLVKQEILSKPISSVQLSPVKPNDVAMAVLSESFIKIAVGLEKVKTAQESVRAYNAEFNTAILISMIEMNLDRKLYVFDSKSMMFIPKGTSEAI